MVTQAQLRQRFCRRWRRLNACLPALAQTPLSRLGERLADMHLAPACVLSAGGDGQWLQTLYPSARVVVADFVADKIVTSQPALCGVCCDGEQLPLADASVDLIGSAFFWEWSDPTRLLAEFRRVLKPEGLLAMASLGAGSLQELRQVAADAVHDFPDMHDVGDALLHNGFAEPIAEADVFQLFYAQAVDAIADLQQWGIGNLQPSHSGLAGKACRQKLLADYARHHTNAQGKVVMTWEVIYTTCWLRSAAAAPSGESPIRFHP